MSMKIENINEEKPSCVTLWKYWLEEEEREMRKWRENEWRSNEVMCLLLMIIMKIVILLLLSVIFVNIMVMKYSISMKI